jgi:hypothetical protein
MTSLTDQFLKQLQDTALKKSGSPTLQTTLQTQSGENSNDVSFTESTTETDMATLPNKVLKGLNGKSFGYVVGTIIGLLAAYTLGMLAGAFLIHWILTAVGIKALTYAQVVGLLAIWELVKPRQSS